MLAWLCITSASCAYWLVEGDGVMNDVDGVEWRGISWLAYVKEASIAYLKSPQSLPRLGPPMIIGSIMGLILHTCTLRKDREYKSQSVT
jgi:hypothetical protein